MKTTKDDIIKAATKLGLTVKEADSKEEAGFYDKNGEKIEFKDVFPKAWLSEYSE